MYRSSFIVFITTKKCKISITKVYIYITTVSFYVIYTATCFDISMLSSRSTTSFSDTVIELHYLISLDYSFYYFFGGSIFLGVPITTITTQKRNICGQDFFFFFLIGVNKMKIDIVNLAAAVCWVYVNIIFYQNLKLVDEIFMVLSFVLGIVSWIFVRITRWWLWTEVICGNAILKKDGNVE
jgi:hypothetical protein